MQEGIVHPGTKEDRRRQEARESDALRKFRERLQTAEVERDRAIGIAERTQRDAVQAQARLNEFEAEHRSTLTGGYVNGERLLGDEDTRRQRRALQGVLQEKSAIARTAREAAEEANLAVLRLERQGS
jgi:hypothetical protein